MIMSPCYKCEERHLNCHSECERYKEFRGKMDAILEKKRAANNLASDHIEVRRVWKKKVRRR